MSGARTSASKIALTDRHIRVIAHLTHFAATTGNRETPLLERTLDMLEAFMPSIVRVGVPDRLDNALTLLLRPVMDKAGLLRRYYRVALQNHLFSGKNKFIIILIELLLKKHPANQADADGQRDLLRLVYSQDADAHIERLGKDLVEQATLKHHDQLIPAAYACLAFEFGERMNFPRSFEYAQMALCFALKTGDERRKMDSLVYMGNAVAGRLTLARQYLDEAERYAKSLGDTAAHQFITATRGRILVQNGQYVKGIRELKSVLAVFENRGRYYANLLMMIGYAQLRRKRDTEGSAYLEQAIAEFGRAGDRSNQVFAVFLLAHHLLTRQPSDRLRAAQIMDDILPAWSGLLSQERSRHLQQDHVKQLLAELHLMSRFKID